MLLVIMLKNILKLNEVYQVITIDNNNPPMGIINDCNRLSYV